jgi:hypothetical protein
MNKTVIRVIPLDSYLRERENRTGVLEQTALTLIVGVRHPETHRQRLHMQVVLVVHQVLPEPEVLELNKAPSALMIWLYNPTLDELLGRLNLIAALRLVAQISPSYRRPKWPPRKPPGGDFPVTPPVSVLASRRCLSMPARADAAGVTGT